MSNSSSSLGIVDEDVEHEAVELGLGQRIGAFLLDRVLRGQHEERLGQRCRVPPDGDLVLLHRLQQRRLRLGRRAVDLVGQDHVGEDRALAGTGTRALPERLSSWITSVPVMSEGIRSGVNWMRLNSSDRASASVRISSVLARPGTPTSRQCPRANMAISSSSITCCWPTITRPSCSVIEAVGLVEFLHGLDVVVLEHDCRFHLNVSRRSPLAAASSSAGRSRHHQFPVGGDQQVPVGDQQIAAASVQRTKLDLFL